MVVAEMSFVESAVLGSLPYLIKDVISVVLAIFVGAALKRGLHAANLLSYAQKA